MVRRKYSEEELVLMSSVVELLKGVRDPELKEVMTKQLNKRMSSATFDNFNQMYHAWYNAKQTDLKQPVTANSPEYVSGLVGSKLTGRSYDLSLSNNNLRNKPMDVLVQYTNSQLSSLDEQLVEFKSAIEELENSKKRFISDRESLLTDWLSKVHDYLISGWNLNNYVSENGVITLKIDSKDRLYQLSDLLKKSDSIKYIPLVLVQDHFEGTKDKYVLLPLHHEDILVGREFSRSPLKTKKQSSLFYQSIVTSLGELYSRSDDPVNFWNGFVAVPLGKPLDENNSSRIDELSGLVNTMINGYKPHIAKDKSLKIIPDSIKFYKGL